MAWTPREVKDQIVEFPNRFKIDGVPHIIEPDFGTVVEPGTPINKAYLQPIEDYLAQVETKDEVQARIDAHKNEKATQDEYGHIRLSDIPKPYVHDSVTGENWQWKMENGIVFLEKVVE